MRQKPASAKLVQCAGDIDHFDIGHGFHRARRGLGQCAGLGRGMAVLHHHGGHAESGGGAQDRADIVGIGKLVQHQNDAAAFLWLGQHLVQVAARRGVAGLQRRTLMHRAGRQQPGDGLGICRFHPHPAQQFGTRASRPPGRSERPDPVCGGDWPGPPLRHGGHRASFPAFPACFRIGASGSGQAVRLLAVRAMAMGRLGLFVGFVGAHGALYRCVGLRQDGVPRGAAKPAEFRHFRGRYAP